jgi:hypothetical protein
LSKEALCFALRRPASANPANPNSIDTQVDGSGTTE